MRFFGISSVERSMGSLGIKVDMIGMIRNVNVRVYVPSVEVIVAVMCRLEVVVKVSRAPIGTEHLFCLILNDFANSSVMKFILDPVSSNARQRIGCCLSFKILICAVMTRSLDSNSDAIGLICSVMNGVVDRRRHWLCVRLSLGGGLADAAVRGVSDLWSVVCLLRRVGDT